MRFTSDQVTCRLCNVPMDRDISIPAVGTLDGLLYYTCPKCGATDSRIVRPQRETDPTPRPKDQ
jgi:hypothetical protein